MLSMYDIDMITVRNTSSGRSEYIQMNDNFTYAIYPNECATFQVPEMTPSFLSNIYSLIERGHLEIIEIKPDIFMPINEKSSRNKTRMEMLEI